MAISERTRRELDRLTRVPKAPKPPAGSRPRSWRDDPRPRSGRSGRLPSVIDDETGRKIQRGGRIPGVRIGDVRGDTPRQRIPMEKWKKVAGLMGKSYRKKSRKK